MNEALESARTLRDRLYVDATHAKNREEYIRTVANYNDMARIVLLIETVNHGSEAAQLAAAEEILDGAGVVKIDPA